MTLTNDDKRNVGDVVEIALCQFGGGQIVSTCFQTDMPTLMSQPGVGGEAPARA
jgi:hypothetical protein